jgi:predicted nucleic acid-binding protein
VVSVTLDTNIYVSALQFSGSASRLLGMVRYGKLRLDVSDTILDELITVLRDDFAWDGYRMHFMRQEIVRMSNLVVPTENS